MTEALSQRRFSPLLFVACLAGGLAVGATLLLWAHYGSAVFYEMLLAGLAACF